MEEKEKYEIVWRDCKRYGKDWTDRGLGRKYKTWFNKSATPAARVTDFGCGNGTSLKWLESCGYKATGFDIARNAIKTNGKSVVFGDLREAVDVEQLPLSEFGLCTDLMEHIPTESVDAVIANIAGKVTRGVLFGIARLPDKDGEALGLVLHLTIADRQWWDTAMRKHFSRIEELVYNDGAYVFWAWKK
jgi:2-polyprenyl-3-methyl-5-hydroxy-6-metoxy-1,4-benzoquinol methylase